MPVFEYKALNKKGKNISGFIDADNMKNARARLRSSQIFPSHMSEVKNGTGNRTNDLSLFSPRVRLSEISGMTRQLSTLVTAGFPLTSALNTMLPQLPKESFRRVLSNVKDGIEEGNSFADSLARYPAIFSNIYINMVRAGEASGTLGIVLDRLADIFEKQNKLNKRVRSAMAYPILMALIGVAVLSFLLTVIVPNITSIFEDMNQTLPLITQTLIDTSGFLTQWWPLVIVLIAALIFLYLYLRKRLKFQTARDRFILKVPLAGDLVRKVAIARLTRTLGSLLENGVPLLNALDIVENVTGNKIIEHAILEARQEVERGRELGDVFGRHSSFPYFAVQMIKIGEQSGSLEDMLKKTADVYEEDVESTIMSITSLMEPAIILIMGVIVGYIVLSICLPIFEMNQLVK